MASLPRKASLDALLECHKELVVFVRNNFKDIVLFFRQKNVIDQKVFREVNDVMCPHSPDDKAEMMVAALQNKVEEDDRNFQIFVQLLKEKYSDLNITAQLKSAMAKHKIEDSSSNVILQQAFRSNSALDSDLELLNLKDNFDNILFNLMSHIKAHRDLVNQLDWVKNTLMQRPPILLDSHSSETKDSISNFMSLISAHSTFFNYELVKRICKSLKYEDGNQQIVEYERQFHAFVKSRRAAMFPKCGVGVQKGEPKTVKIKLDNSFKKYHQVYIKKLQQDIGRILGVTTEQFLVEGVELSSIYVIFHLLKILVNKVFPLSDKQLCELKWLDYENAKILSLKCDQWSYSLYETNDCIGNAKIAVCGLTGADRNFIANCVVGYELVQDNDDILSSTNFADKNNQVYLEVTSIEAYDVDRHELDNYRDTLKNLNDEVFDVFLYCITVRAGIPDVDQDKKAFDELRQLLRPNTLDNCIIVLTYADYIVKNGKTRHNTEKVTKQIKRDYEETIGQWSTLVKSSLGSDLPVVPAGSSQCFSVLENDEAWQSIFYHKVIEVITNESAKMSLAKRNLFCLTTKDDLDKLDILKSEHPIVASASTNLDNAVASNGMDNASASTSKVNESASTSTDNASVVSSVENASASISVDNSKIAVCGLTGADRNFVANCAVGYELMQDSDDIIDSMKFEDENNGVFVEVTSIEAYDADRHDLDNYRETLKDLKDEVFDILLYCITVRAGKPDVDQDKKAFHELRKLLHPNTLDKCIIVLTYVDYIVKNGKTRHNTEKITKQIKRDFEETLGQWIYIVKNNLGSKLPVVPAGSSQCFSVLENDEAWQSIFYHEVIEVITNESAKMSLVKRNLFRLTTKDNLDKLDILKRRYYEHPIVVGEHSTKIKEKLAEVLAGVSVGGVTGAVGATVGALIGALLIGVPSFGVFAGTGLALGAAIRGGIGAGTGVTVTKHFQDIKEKKKKKKTKDLSKTTSPFSNVFNSS